MSYLQIVSSIALTPSISQCADQGFCRIDNKHSTDYEFCHIDIKDALAFVHMQTLLGKQNFTLICSGSLLIMK
jgi:hypothetical protein